jgi:adenylate cyclase
MLDPMSGTVGTKVQRRLAAIFAADVEGYSRLMEADEVGTLQTLTAHREIMDRLIEEHGGRIANTAGDSVLAEFPSVVDAVQAAVEAQEALRTANRALSEDHQVQFRIGVHVGDVILKEGDLFGEGVNITARLQALAPPGGVCLSGPAYDHVRKVLPLNFDDLGLQQIKNLIEPIRVYAVVVPSLVQSSSPHRAQNASSEPLVDRPSIAVLPFANLSSDPDQEYFADGIVEDIISSLARFPSLFVVARNSSFTFRGRSLDLKQIGRQLGVRYILEGSIRRATNRVRLTCQLIDAETGASLWADKFDGELGDVFALQDDITERVVGLIHPRIQRAEIEASTRRRPQSVTAYDLYLRALALFHSLTHSGSDEALQLLQRALELEPRFGPAASLASMTCTCRIAQGWATDLQRETNESIRLNRLALDIDPNDPDALAIYGRNVSYSGRDFEGGIEAVDRAVELCPNSAFAWSQRGWTYTYAARPLDAEVSYLRAMHLSPLDLTLYSTLTGLSFAYVQLERFHDAVEVARRAIQQNAHYSSTFRILAAALAQLGRFDEAQDARQEMLKLEPNFRISEWTARSPWRYPAREIYIDGLRKAGFPK